MIKIGINGFGRIGRMVFRAAVQNFSQDVEIVGINDLLEPDYLAYMLKFDSVHGRFKGDVSTEGTSLIVNGKKIRLTAVKDPSTLKWDEVGADIVVESTGLFLDHASAEAHLKAGAKKVIMSAPSKDETPMFVYGVNHASYAGQTIISNASCTTNCLAPLVKVLDENFGILHGFASTVHSYTNDQNLHDAPHKDLRRARAAAYSIIPTTTNAGKALDRILPTLAGKIEASAMRVPVPDGSLTDLIVTVGKEVTTREVNDAFKKAAALDLKGYLQIESDPIVSMDILGNSHSAILDEALTSTKGNLVKVVAWYDNESGYANRLVDLAKKISYN